MQPIADNHILHKMSYDKHIVNCVFTFLSQTNVKRYGLYCFENDMLLGDEQNRTLLDITMLHENVQAGFYVNLFYARQTFFKVVCSCIWYCFDVGFEHFCDTDNVFDFIGTSNFITIQWVHNALCNYPPYHEHIENVKQMQECDIVKIANIFVREHNVITKNQTVAIEFPRGLCPLYAFDEFVEENNIEQYIRFCFENFDRFGCDLLWTYINGDKQTRKPLVTHVRSYIVILPHLRKLNMNKKDAHGKDKLDVLFESNFHKTFVMQHYAERNERKNAFVFVVDAIFDDYGHERIVDRILVDDYIVKHIYGFL